MNALGWSPSRAEEFESYASGGLAPARVAAQHRGGYVVYTERGERPAELAGRLHHSAVVAAGGRARERGLPLEDRLDGRGGGVRRVVDGHPVADRGQVGPRARRMGQPAGEH
jgi:hypothetical protein